jgi:Fe-S cluster assembly protein SufD
MTGSPIQEFLAAWGGAALSEPDWLAARRAAARAALAARGFPTLRDEDWKYTDVRPIVSRRFRAGAGVPVPLALLDAASFAGARIHELQFGNGAFVQKAGAAIPAGVIVLPLAQALAEHGVALSGQLACHARPDKHGFLALNTALAGDGALVFVPDDIQVDVPVGLLFASAAGNEPSGSCPRNIVVLGRNARATVIETYTGADGGEYLTNAVTEARLGPGAQLIHYRVQQEGAQAFHVANLSVTQEQDSRLESHAISLGALLARNEIDVRLAGGGAQTVLNGLYLADGRQHTDNHTRIDHEVPGTGSDEHYRGVLGGRARAVFNGKVVVHRDAQKTDAHQANANLLLSDDAEVDTKPELEIYADDVKCSHGASIGRLDDNMLFYLRSRAVPAAIARSLLIYAFADEVIRRMAFAPVRARIEQRVLGRLPDAELIREFVQ